MVRIPFALIFTRLIYISGSQPELQNFGEGGGVTATGPRIHLSNKDCHFDLLYPSSPQNTAWIMGFVSTVLYYRCFLCDQIRIFFIFSIFFICDQIRIFSFFHLWPSKIFYFFVFHFFICDQIRFFHLWPNKNFFIFFIFSFVTK